MEVFENTSIQASVEWVGVFILDHNIIGGFGSGSNTNNKLTPLVN